MSSPSLLYNGKSIMPHKLKPIKPKRISDQVFDQLRELIFRGEFKSGEKILTERELAEAFGVSRTSVRDAINKLVVMGLLEQRQGQGTFVRSPESSEKSIEEMQKEVKSGRLGTEADASFHMAIAYATNNPLQVYIMKNFYDFLFTGIKVNLEGLYKVPGNIDTILEQHQAIYRAIREHNAESAFRAMKRHIDFVYAFFKRQGK